MADAEELVKRFVDTYYMTGTYIDEGNKDAAADQYKRLIGAYNEIAAASIDRCHKELAHEQLRKTYSRLRGLGSQGAVGLFSGTPGVILAVALIAISFLIVLKPSIIGFVALEPNSAPAWDGPRSFELREAGLLNLSQHFSDADGDPLVFVSTSGEGVDVSVTNDIVTLTPRSSSRQNITLIATDFKDVTKVPVEIVVP